MGGAHAGVRRLSFSPIVKPAQPALADDRAGGGCTGWATAAFWQSTCSVRKHAACRRQLGHRHAQLAAPLRQHSAARLSLQPLPPRTPLNPVQPPGPGPP